MRLHTRGTCGPVNSLCLALYMYFFIYFFLSFFICVWPKAPGDVAQRRAAHTSGVRKGGFSKGGLSNLCVITMLLLLSPLYKTPLCELPKFRSSRMWCLRMCLIITIL